MSCRKSNEIQNIQKNPVNSNYRWNILHTVLFH